MSKIVFLGTGGGRVTTMTQLRSTGGIYLELSGTRIYLDPGPGALVRARSAKIPLEKLDAVLVSHNHIDHLNDTAVLVECMTRGVREKRGLLAAPVSVLGNKSMPAELPKYHREAPEKTIEVKPGMRFKVKDLEIECMRAIHTDKFTVGYRFFAEKKISYPADTVFSKEVARAHKGADILILNCLYLVNENKCKDVEFAKHMDVDDAIKFAKHIKPELCIIQHFGMGMIRKGPWTQAEHIEKETGIKTVAARDGQIFDVGKECAKKEGLEKFKKD